MGDLAFSTRQNFCKNFETEILARLGIPDPYQ